MNQNKSIKIFVKLIFLVFFSFSLFSSWAQETSDMRKQFLKEVDKIKSEKMTPHLKTKAENMVLGLIKATMIEEIMAGSFLTEIKNSDGSPLKLAEILQKVAEQMKAPRLCEKADQSQKLNQEDQELIKIRNEKGLEAAREWILKNKKIKPLQENEKCFPRPLLGPNEDLNSCLKEGEKFQEGKTCCPGTFKTPEGFCRRFIGHVYKELFSFFNTAEASTPQDVIKAKATQEAANLGLSGQEAQTYINNVMAKHAKEAKMNIDIVSSKGDFTTEWQENANECQFNWRSDLISMMTIEERQAQAAIEAFEFMSVDDVVDDYWKGQQSQGIHVRAKNIAKKFRDHRRIKYQKMSEAAENLRCQCLAIKKGEAPLKVQDQDDYKTKCELSADDGVRKTIKDLENISAQKDTGASSIEYKKIYIDYLELRRQFLMDFTSSRIDISNELNDLNEHILSLHWGQREETTAIRTKCDTLVALDPLFAPMALQNVILYGLGLLGEVDHDYSPIKVTGSDQIEDDRKEVAFWPMPKCLDKGPSFCTNSFVDYGPGVRWECRDVTVKDNLVCQASGPANFCVKAAIRIDDQASKYDGLYVFSDDGTGVLAAADQYLVDPFIPSKLTSIQSPQFTNAVQRRPEVKSGLAQSSFGLLYNVLSMPTNTKADFIALAVRYLEDENLLFSKKEERESFAEYIYRYHFLFPAVGRRPIYPTPGLLPYYSFLAKAALKLSDNGVEGVGNLNDVIIKMTDEMNKSAANMATQYKEVGTGGKMATVSMQHASFIKGAIGNLTQQNGQASSSSTPPLEKEGEQKTTASASLKSFEKSLQQLAALKKKRAKREQDVALALKSGGEGPVLQQKANEQIKALEKAFLNPLSSASLAKEVKAAKAADLQKNKINQGHSTKPSKASNEEAKVDFDSNIMSDDEDLNRNRVKSTSDGSKEYTLNEDELRSLRAQEGETLFQIVTRRYILSAFPRLLQKKEKR